MKHKYAFQSCDYVRFFVCLSVCFMDKLTKVEQVLEFYSVMSINGNRVVMTLEKSSLNTKITSLLFFFYWLGFIFCSLGRYFLTKEKFKGFRNTWRIKGFKLRLVLRHVNATLVASMLRMFKAELEKVCLHSFHHFQTSKENSHMLKIKLKRFIFCVL